jgi:hypothetical protein
LCGKKSGSCLLLMMSLSCAEVRSEIDGPPIVDNNYNLDLRHGPVLGSSRKVALGGAYIGVAEGIASLSSNPAGVAFRPERSTTKFDWDWTAGLTDLDSDDFDNNGETPPDYNAGCPKYGRRSEAGDVRYVNPNLRAEGEETGFAIYTSRKGLVGSSM